MTSNLIQFVERKCLSIKNEHIFLLCSFQQTPKNLTRFSVLYKISSHCIQSIETLWAVTTVTSYCTFVFTFWVFNWCSYSCCSILCSYSGCSIWCSYSGCSILCSYSCCLILCSYSGCSILCSYSCCSIWCSYSGCSISCSYSKKLIPTILLYSTSRAKYSVHISSFNVVFLW